VVEHFWKALCRIPSTTKKKFKKKKKLTL
jgi:hypothetical protein